VFGPNYALHFLERSDKVRVTLTETNLGETRMSAVANSFCNHEFVFFYATEKNVSETFVVCLL